MRAECDVLVGGGGINGAAIARDAAGRGARVMLVEQGDLASQTSSASTKLIHGGLRYLEHYEFRLVSKALAERERLMEAAPHLVRPLQFVLPHDPAMRPRWMIRIGLFLYDWLAGRGRLPATRAVRLDRSAFGAALRESYRHGYAYWDCWGDDSRLVVANAEDAARRGATVLTRTRVVRAERRDEGWHVHLETGDGQTSTIVARALVNATGCWATEFLAKEAGVADEAHLRLVKGSHIVTRRLYDGDHAFILQNDDGRIVFVIPYEQDFTLIGTTEVVWNGPPGTPKLDEAELEYLCRAANRWLRRPISSEDVVWSYSGLRPLFDDAAANPSDVSRDYVLELDGGDGAAPVLSVLGGKITTHRALAEDAMDRLARQVEGLGPAWTGNAKLPGGEFGEANLDALARELKARAPFLDQRTAGRLAASYGAAAFEVLGGARELRDLGQGFGAGLTEAEVQYLRSREWAESAEDIVWRRSKLGLRMTQDEIRRLDDWLAASRGSEGS